MKSLKITRNQAAIVVLLLSAVINSLTYVFSPHLLLLLVFLEVILFAIIVKDLVFKLWLIYLFCLLYSDIAVFGLKLYDLSILFFAPLIFIRVRKINGAVLRQLVLAITIVFFLLVNYLYSEFKSNFIIELVRYVACFITFFVFVQERLEIDKLKLIIRGIILANILLGAITFYFKINQNFPVEIQGPFYHFNFAGIEKEMRVSGFFLDPNKYYLVIMFLLFLHEYLVNIGKIGPDLWIRLLAVAGILSSLSRTALIIVVLYFAILFVKEKIFSKRALKIYYSVYYFLIFTGIFLFPLILKFLDDFLYQITIFLGREDSLRYSASVSESNRVRVWKWTVDNLEGKWIFGKGLGSWQEAFYYPTHNTFLGLISDIGFFGIVLYLLFMGKLMKYFFKEYFLFLVFLPMFTLDLQTYRLLFVCLATVFIYEGKRKDLHYRPS